MSMSSPMMATMSSHLSSMKIWCGNVKMRLFWPFLVGIVVVTSVASTEAIGWWHVFYGLVASMAFTAGSGEAASFQISRVILHSHA